MLKLRKLKGFTLVELLVVVVIIGILAAIALPNFIGAQAKAKNASVKGNMRTVQIASESYATDSGGAYSSSSSASTGTWADYLPGGSNSIASGTVGTLPLNPMTGSTSTVGSGGVTNVQTTRAAAPGSFSPGTGNLGYDGLGSGTSYAVTGGDTNGKQISNAGGTLVLSNQ